MGHAEIPLRHWEAGQTARRDFWWAQSLLVLLAFTSFIVYVTWAAFQGRHYHWGPYLSPLYSPELFGDSPNSWFGPKPSWYPAYLPWSPALLILWAPGLFRLTCYYYRGAYYKAFWADPPACTVTEPRNKYLGERYFPLVMQNVHRYFLYLALIFLLILGHDVWNALWFRNPSTGQLEFGIGVGTLVLAVNLTLLGSYALGCHSLRHLIGGRFDLMLPWRHTVYSCVTCLNARHSRFAAVSLFWVAFSDFYVRMCATGIWSDWRIL
jgi:hypothetical protein